MEWMKAIENAIAYIENHILEDFTIEDVAENVNLSPFYFQKGFAIMCGFTVSEYIRNRRLALAGNEIAATDKRIIDVALKYGYESPDSFTKAFTRFHGSTPLSVRRDGATLKSFAPLKIKIMLTGGNFMDYRIETKEAFQVLAKGKVFSNETAKRDIPAFWNEHHRENGGEIVAGEFGICIEDGKGSDFRYLIADSYKGQDCPKGYELLTIPSFTWAVFPCKGPMPNALQNLTTEIFMEWLPANREYALAAGYEIEMYDCPEKYAKGTDDENYYCEIWIPIKRN